MKIIYVTDVHGVFERVRQLLSETEADVYIIVPCLINCVRDFGNLSFQIDDAVRQPWLKVQYD